MKSIAEKPRSNAAPKELSLLGLARALFEGASRVYPEKGAQRAKDRAKFCLRGFAMPRLTRQWFQMLAKPELAVAVRNCPRILSKLQRPYLHRKLKPTEQLQILQEHYRFVQQSFPPETLEKIYSDHGALLADIPLEGVGHFSLRLAHWSSTEKEGELTVSLVNESTPAAMFMMTFSFTSYQPGGSEIFIGGLQTVRKATSRELVVDITRGMYGLRPKALLLFVVQQLAAIWNIKTLRAVSNDMIVFRHARLQKKKVFADYDEFWVESDGQLGVDGFFTLPTQFVSRPIVEIKPNKRTLYKHRYALLEKLGIQIADNTRLLGHNASNL